MEQSEQVGFIYWKEEKMRQIFIFLSTFLIFFISAISALSNQYWAKTYGNSHWDYAKAIQETTDGGYIIAGNTLSFGSPYEVWLLKLDNMGNIAWEKNTQKMI